MADLTEDDVIVKVTGVQEAVSNSVDQIGRE
jgi:hypothetical protein